MPDYNTRVLTCAHGRFFAVAILSLIQTDCWIKDSGCQAAMGKVTHWMPLPSETTEDNQNEGKE